MNSNEVDFFVQLHQRTLSENRFGIMNRTAFILLVILGLSSCTVEKRLYNRGWNVQWRKQLKVVTEERTASQISATEVDLAEIQPIERAAIRLKSSEKDFQNDGDRNPVLKVEISEENRLVDQNTMEMTVMEVKTVTPVCENVSKQLGALSYYKKGAINPEDTRKVGRGILITSIVSLILSIGLLYFMLGAAVTVADLMFALLLCAFFGILGLVLLMVGLSVINKSKKMASQ